MGDIEVIVVVDGGDPATVAALERIDDRRLRVLVLPQALGAGRARDTGADAATGDWIAFLDDDDEWLPEKLERQLAAAPPGGKAVLSTLYRVVSSQGERICPALPYRGDQPIDEWLFGRQTWLRGHEAMIQTSALMVPRAMFQSLRFRDTRQHEEWELCLRAVKDLGHAFVTVREPLVIYHAPAPDAQTLSKSYRMELSMAWADHVGPLLTRRAYSGFALTVASQVPSSGARLPALGRLFTAAFAKGRPTAKQLFAFGLIVLLPHDLRRRIRARLARPPGSPGAA
jgi:glycosyltransferase involved in cell wall biosynthesis